LPPDRLCLDGMRSRPPSRDRRKNPRYRSYRIRCRVMGWATAPSAVVRSSTGDGSRRMRTLRCGEAPAENMVELLAAGLTTAMLSCHVRCGVSQACRLGHSRPMAIIDDYAAIAAELRRLRAERSADPPAPPDQPKARPVLGSWHPMRATAGGEALYRRLVSQTKARSSWER
jgi:hypothetical protein